MITENESVRLIFGLKLRSLRLQKNLSYQQLSEESKITISYLHDLENGKKYPKADKILTLAKALGVDYDYLVSLSGDKKIQPLIDIISSEYINVIPWEHFGIAPATLLEIFTNTPDKVTAFITTLVKISRAFHLTKDNFYFTALQSFQDLHYNYFEKFENAANRWREEFKLLDAIPITTEKLESILLKNYSIQIDRKKMGHSAVLNRLRSYYSPTKKIFYINKHLTNAQENFLLAREIAFQYLELNPRPLETIVQQSKSFDLLLNNLFASYFAAAILIPEGSIAEDFKQISSTSTWNGLAWLDILDKYNITTEMFIQRLTSILPHHFGINQLFFLRMYGSDKNGFAISKELHLSQLHNPHANLVNEHYCRRWGAITAIQNQQALPEKKKYKDLHIDIQISHYWQTQNRYLCITISKPPIDKKSENSGSVTLGLLIDGNLMKLMNFLNDPNIITKTVHTTCERCSIADCKERVSEPIQIQKYAKELEIKKAIESLDK